MGVSSLWVLNVGVGYWRGELRMLVLSLVAGEKAGSGEATKLPKCRKAVQPGGSPSLAKGVLVPCWPRIFAVKMGTGYIQGGKASAP